MNGFEYVSGHAHFQYFTHNACITLMCRYKYTFFRLTDKVQNVKISKIGTNILFMVTIVTKEQTNFAMLKIIQE